MSVVRIALGKCQDRLMTLWLSVSAVLFLVMWAQMLSGRYGDETSRAWEWFLPTFLPALALIVSGRIYVGVKHLGQQLVDRALYRLSLGLSIVYLLVAASVLLVQPYTPWKPLELMITSHTILAPIQGLVTAALGVFFISERESGGGAG